MTPSLRSRMHAPCGQHLMTEYQRDSSSQIDHTTLIP